MYIFAGFVQNAWICLPVGVALTVGTAFVIRMIDQKRHPVPVAAEGAVAEACEESPEAQAE